MGQKINIVIDQGANFITTFNVIDENNVPVDLSTYASKATMKQTYTSANSYIMNISSYANGAIIVSMNASYSNTIASGRYVYDIELTNTTGNVSRVIEGIATVTPGVSR